jgi:biotin-dependent carboxylase-like uncharacterized protein
MGLLVIDPGLSTTVQDSGRPGYREFGVPLGGAFDRGSADLANALVGNPADRGVLEMTLSGGTYQADAALALALAGAPMEAKVIAPDSREQFLHLPLSFTLKAGERLVLGRPRDGARTYLAVAGGWQTRRIMGSYSSERRIRAGELLPAESATIATRHPIGPTWQSPAAEPLHIIDGPDARSYPEFEVSFWSGRRFTVDARSDRIGLRLSGDALTIAAAPDRRLSSPVAPGAIQVAGGQLIVLGVGCGTMGGYPHLAHVITPDLDRLGQLKPGDAIQFHRLGITEARAADERTREARRILLRRVMVQAADGAD